MFEKIALFVLSFLGSRFKVTLGLLGLAIVGVIAVAGFRGTPTTRTPIELFPDMDRQPKLRPQTVSQFSAFADGRTSAGFQSGPSPSGMDFPRTLTGKTTRSTPARKARPSLKPTRSQ